MDCWDAETRIVIADVGKTGQLVVEELGQCASRTGICIHTANGAALQIVDIAARGMQARAGKPQSTIEQSFKIDV